MADTIHYVDTGAAANGNGNTNALSGADCAYQSLSQWEAAEQCDVTATGGNHVVHCNRTNGGGMDTGGLYIYTWTTDSTHRIIVVQDDFPANGKYDESRFVIYNNDNLAQAVAIREEYVTLQHLQIKCTSAGTTTRQGVLVNSGWLGTSEVVVDSCILVGDCPGTGISSGIRLSDGSVSIFNCLIYGWKYAGFYVDAIDALSVLNCTVYGCGTYGIRAVTTGQSIVNCAVFGNGDDFYTGMSGIDHCASDDGDGTNAVNISPGATEATDWAAAFTDYTNGDFSIKDTSSVLYDAGTDDPGSGLYSEDIVGTARSSPWDIGAFEYASGSPPAGLPVPVAMNHYKLRRAG